MSHKERFVIIQPDAEKRERWLRNLPGTEFKVEAYATMDEIRTDHREFAVLFIPDDDQLVQDALKYVRQRERGALVLYAHSPKVHRVVDAIAAGCFDYIDLADPWDWNIGRMRNLRQRETYQVVSSDARERANRKLALLSQREREVLKRLSEGMTNKHIARQLAISPRTVEIHRSNMRAKIGGVSTSEAVALAAKGDLDIE